MTSTIGAVALAMALSPAAQAAFINGNMAFGGGNVELLDSGGVVTSDFTAARGLEFHDGPELLPGVPIGPRVGVATGDFAGLLTALVTFDQNPWMFDPVSGGALWSVGDFTFIVQSAAYTVTQIIGQDTLEVVGTGVVSNTLTGDTGSGVWVFTTQRTGNTADTLLTWSSDASVVSPVPDGGTTLVLLGATLLGLHGVRRKFVRA